MLQVDHIKLISLELFEQVLIGAIYYYSHQKDHLFKL